MLLMNRPHITHTGILLHRTKGNLFNRMDTFLPHPSTIVSTMQAIFLDDVAAVIEAEAGPFWSKQDSLWSKRRVKNRRMPRNESMSTKAKIRRPIDHGLILPYKV